MIQMILESKASEISNEKSRVAANISQLIRFNSVKQRRGSAENARHCITNEPPLEELCVQHQQVKDIQ